MSVIQQQEDKIGIASSLIDLDNTSLRELRTLNSSALRHSLTFVIEEAGHPKMSAGNCSVARQQPS